MAAPLCPDLGNMIHSILQVLKNDLGAFLKKRLGEREEVVLLSQLMNNADGGFAVLEENRLICTLLNIEQERLNLNAPLGHRTLVNPPFNLNLYVLFSAYYAPTNYVGALRTLSLAIGFFQGKQVFTPANTPGMPATVDKIIAEMVNVDMKDLSNFWTALGAKQMPSVLFKIKMVSITADMVMEEYVPITGVE
jgi:Pvc16 N-terminal domain